MALFKVRLDDMLAARFDALALKHGGRSALLRALVHRVAADQPADVAPPPVKSPRGRNRVEVRLSADDMVRLDRLAAQRGQSRADWIATLVRHRLGGPASPPRDVAQALVDAWRQLKKIGLNLNQAVHALHSARMTDSRLDLAREAERVAGFRDEVVEQSRHIRAILAGERAYWESDDDR
jgi:predicted transcriptional regulator